MGGAALPDGVVHRALSLCLCNLLAHPRVPQPVELVPNLRCVRRLSLSLGRVVGCDLLAGRADEHGVVRSTRSLMHQAPLVHAEPGQWTAGKRARESESSSSRRQGGKEVIQPGGSGQGMVGRE